MIKVATPSRICLFGEHQDYLGLEVIASAINLHFSTKAVKRDDSLLKIKIRDSSIGELGATNDEGKYEEYIMDELAKESDVTVTEEEAWELYEAAPELYDQRRVSHLLVKPYAADGRTLTADSNGNTIYTEEEWATAKASCENYLAELESGEDFGTLALKYSDSADADLGGRMEETLYRDSEGYDKAFLDAAFALTEPGEYTTSPVRTAKGYELILLDGILSPDDMEEVIAYIIENTEDQRRRSLLTEYMAEREKTADIQYFDIK